MTRLKTALLALVMAGSAAAYADQPRMDAALDHLQVAKKQLAEATHDKGGHRAKAIKAIDAAIEEVKAGIEFDRTHPDH